MNQVDILKRCKNLNPCVLHTVGQDCFTCCTEKTLQGDALGLLECRPEDQQHPDESMNVASISQTLGKREYMDTDTRKKLRADQKEKMMMLEQAEEI